MATANEAESNATIARLVGSIVLSSQTVEHYLKAILPFTNADKPSLDAAMERHAKLSKATLGKLLDDFKAIGKAESGAFGAHLDWINEQRNDIVHGFARKYGDQLSAGRHDEVIQNLRTIAANIEALRKSLGALVVILV